MTKLISVRSNGSYIIHFLGAGLLYESLSLSVCKSQLLLKFKDDIYKKKFKITFLTKTTFYIASQNFQGVNLYTRIGCKYSLYIFRGHFSNPANNSFDNKQNFENTIIMQFGCKKNYRTFVYAEKIKIKKLQLKKERIWGDKFTFAS